MCVNVFVDAFPSTESSSVKGIYLNIANLKVIAMPVTPICIFAVQFLTTFLVSHQEPTQHLLCLLPSNADIFSALRAIFVAPLRTDDDQPLMRDGSAVHPLLALEDAALVVNGRRFVGGIHALLGDIPGIAEIAGLAGVCALHPSRYGVSSRDSPLGGDFVDFNCTPSPRSAATTFQAILQIRDLAQSAGNLKRIEILETEHGLAHRRGDVRALLQHGDSFILL